MSEAVKEKGKSMYKRLQTAMVLAAAVAATSTHAFAITGGRLAATAAINSVAGEFAGPMAYSLSLIAVVGTAVSWYRHHHEMGSLANGLLGVGFVGGMAIGATSLLGMIPGATGALI
jgi:type IV secretory pathway VirB2 component (pilin)